jgi:DNA-binding NarL/FixJ family response regulator
MKHLANTVVPISGTQKMPAIVIIEDALLARTCIVNILRKEFAGFEIIEMATPSRLNGLSGKEVRLVAFNMGDKQIIDAWVEHRLAFIEESCPNAYIALLSNRDDEDTASAVMQRGVHGFFPTTIAVEVAIAGLHLVLAGAVYRPLPVIGHEGMSLKAISEPTGAPALSAASDDNTLARITPERAMAGLTPREQQVLAALKLGLPNKLIAVRLNLSENTVKMHIQHIMRKCCARNRTEAVLRWSGQSNGHAPSSQALSTS